MSADILNRLGYADVTPIAPRGGSDGGRDITFRNYDNKPALACVSLRKDAKNKALSDLKQRKAGDYDEYIFFTNQYLTSEEKLEIAGYCIENLKAQFIARDIEGLRSLLDAQMQDLREKYLHIVNPEHPTYTVKVTDARTFSITNKLSKARKDLVNYKDELESEHSANPFALAMPRISPFKSTPSEMVTQQASYIQKLEIHSGELSRKVGFNLEITCSTYDEHVEVMVIPPEGCELNFGISDLLPDKPVRDTLLSPISLGRMSSHRDHSEFYAIKNESNGTIKSNLEKINPNHPKLLFDEDVYVSLLNDDSSFEVSVRIFSSKLKNPQDIKISFDKTKAREVQLR